LRQEYGHWVTSPLRPGQGAQAQVTMQNLAGTTWMVNGSNPLRLIAQNPQHNSTWERTGRGATRRRAR
jgi:hypothetical protein